MYLLEQLGWNSRFEREFRKFQKPNTVPGRIYVEERKKYGIITSNGQHWVTLPGKHYYRVESNEDLPVTGDWVIINCYNKTITKILPRSTLLKRKSSGTRKRYQTKRQSTHLLAANIDIVFIVSGLDTDFNLRRIERYLTLVKGSGAKPVVLLNKTDLCQNVEYYLGLARSVSGNTQIFTCCAHKTEDLLPMYKYLKPGQTGVILGSSGVGKSTIINTLLGYNRQPTQNTSPRIQKGKHTTSQREMIVLNNGGVIIDTPGLREIQLSGAPDDIRKAFPDIEEIASDCRFNDCQHDKEPDCAVKEAIQCGSLDVHRLENYRKMKLEMLNANDKA